MISIETITLVTGVLMCVIGVCTFVTGLTNRAKSDGALSQKVDSTLKGIEEIKDSLKEQHSWREQAGMLLERHSQQINTLFRRVEKLEKSKVCVEAVELKVEDN